MKLLKRLVVLQIRFKTLLLINFLIMINFTVIASQKSDGISPEIYDLNLLMNKNLELKKNGKPVIANKWMVVTANKKASEAAARVLHSGGNAIDAMVTAQLVLGLVEPESSGLGGGAFLVYYEKKTKKLITLDGRETAPLEVKADHFQDKKGNPLTFFEAVVGGKSVGVPGTPALLEKAHQKWGKKKWEELFKDAIQLAEKGFPVSKKLSSSIKKNRKSLKKYKITKNYFLPLGKSLEYGNIKTNVNYANTLKLFSKYGSDVFYSGTIGEDIISTVRNVKVNPGKLSKIDLLNYEVKERNPVCSLYRKYKVCGMGPPSSGAITINQILGIVERYDLSKLGYNNSETWRIIGDASRLAFADRGKYIADPDFVTVPISKLIDKNYLMKRSKLIKEKDFGKAKPGIFSLEQTYNQAFSFEVPSTSHISIIDQNGNAVSMTTSIEMAFGSTLMVRGFLLNNQLTDFSFRKEKDGKKIANSVEPGKRPRSSMSPIIVFDKNNNVKLIIGSPGGSRIIGYVLKTLIAYLDWGMDIQDSINFPNFLNRNGKTDLEKNSVIVKYKSGLIKRGHKISVRNLNSGLHGISINDSKIYGGADFRREGTVLGK